MTFYRFFNLAGDNSKEATPDPIPNSEVKLFCVDGTARVTVWESRTSPAFFCFCDWLAHLLRQLRYSFGGNVRVYAPTHI